MCCTTHWLKCLHERVSSSTWSSTLCVYPFFDSLFLTLFFSVCFSNPFFFHLNPELGKKQTLVSHSSTEAEVISLDASLRMDGIPALDLWDSVIEVFHSSPNRPTKPKMKESHGDGRQLLNHTSENRFQPPTPISI